MYIRFGALPVCAKAAIGLYKAPVAVNTVILSTNSTFFEILSAFRYLEVIQQGFENIFKSNEVLLNVNSSFYYALLRILYLFFTIILEILKYKFNDRNYLIAPGLGKFGN